MCLQILVMYYTLYIVGFFPKAFPVRLVVFSVVKTVLLNNLNVFFPP